MRRQEMHSLTGPSERAARLPRNGLDRADGVRSQPMLTALAILSLGLMFATRAALAEPSDVAMLASLAASPAALAPVVAEEETGTLGSSGFPEATPAFTVPAADEPLPTTIRPLVAVPAYGLEALLALRTAPSVPAAADTDAAIAAAVAEGSRPDLEQKPAFRKKNFDLFRTEREVEILRNDMLLRLRLRAKSRETMSVELRF